MQTTRQNEVHPIPFQLAWIFYLMAGLLWSSVKGKKKANRGAFVLFNLAFLIHIAGFVLRCMISGRPPVTNMYESVIWVSLGVCVFAQVLWLFYRATVIVRTAAFVATLALILGQSLPTVLDASISPLVPVLRSNYWLTIHVLTITLSYGALMLNFGIAHVLLYQYAFKPRQKKRIAELTEYLYRSLQIGLILLASGTILGGVWAAYSWGRFWGWDPKETWALIAILAYLAVYHGRIAGWLSEFQVALWCALCFLTVIMAWYGVNFVLASGLHSYGFGTGGLPYVLAVIGGDVFLLLFLASRVKMSAGKA